MPQPTFEPWPKIARLNRDCIITEKIDGTNAAVLVLEASPSDRHDRPHGTTLVDTEAHLYLVAAQSRTRLITIEDDNFGFARWVHENAEALAAALGPGRHFGEWWGQGIQRKYGQSRKRFSLFNVSRYAAVDFTALPEVGMVPTLYSGPFSTEAVAREVAKLAEHGSVAAPGFMRPEGVVVFHVAAQTVFKVTCEKDEAPKGMTA